MADLLRRGRYADEVMGILAAESRQAVTSGLRRAPVRTRIATNHGQKPSTPERYDRCPLCYRSPSGDRCCSSRARRDGGGLMNSETSRKTACTVAALLLPLLFVSCNRQSVTERKGTGCRTKRHEPCKPVGAGRNQRTRRDACGQEAGDRCRLCGIHPSDAAVERDPDAIKALEEMGRYLRTLNAFQIHSQTTPRRSARRRPDHQVWRYRRHDRGEAEPFARRSHDRQATAAVLRRWKDLQRVGSARELLRDDSRAADAQRTRGHAGRQIQPRAAGRRSLLLGRPQKHR